MDTRIRKEYIMTKNITINNNGYAYVELFLNGNYHMWEFYKHKLIEHDIWKI